MNTPNAVKVTAPGKLATRPKVKGALLVLEDSHPDFQWLDPVLQSHGWKVERAKTVQDARRLLIRHAETPRYACAILDVMVPQCSLRELGKMTREDLKPMLRGGVQAAEYIRNGLRLGRRQLPIIFLTVLSRAELETDIRTLDADYCDKMSCAFDTNALLNLLPRPNATT